MFLSDMRSRAALRPMPLRVLTLLLLLAQLAPAAAAHADPPPTPVVHADHLGGSDDRGCQPFHDALHCVACRLLSTQPIGPGDTFGIPVAPVERPLAAASYDRLTPDPAHRSSLRARAPPTS